MAVVVGALIHGCSAPRERSAWSWLCRDARRYNSGHDLLGVRRPSDRITGSPQKARRASSTTSVPRSRKRAEIAWCCTDHYPAGAVLMPKPARDRLARLLAGTGSARADSAMLRLPGDVLTLEVANLGPIQTLS